MMSGDNFSEKRSVLGDLTNRPLKRGFSKTLSDSGLKSGDGNGQNVAGEDGYSPSPKQVCLGVDILDKEKCETKVPPPPNSNVDASQGNVVSVPSLKPSEAIEAANLLDDSVHSVKSGTMSQSAGEVGEASRDSCASTGSMPVNFGMQTKESDDEEERPSSDAMLSNDGGLDSHVCTSDEKDLEADRFVTGKFGPLEMPWLPKSQGSKSFELDRCTTLKDEFCPNMNASADLLKSCSCSFCLKAAFIWSDLYYQDMKGRISALKKSQKEASILVNKYSMGKKTDDCGQGSSSNASKLESDLTGQWRSLFRHMEDLFADENSQLQASFATLKDLRENCKMDLEKIAGVPSDKC